MYSTNDFKKGLKLMVEGNPYSIVDFQHVKPGKGNQFCRTKLRNMLTGANLERTFKSGEKFEIPNVETRDMNFLYRDEGGFHFMSPTSYEQLDLDEAAVGDARFYLTDNTAVTILFYNDRAVGVDVPKAVNIRVKETAPGFKGNTVTGATKPATLETGHIVQVPMHITEGDILRVNTLTGDYVERVNK